MSKAQILGLILSPTLSQEKIKHLINLAEYRGVLPWVVCLNILKFFSTCRFMHDSNWEQSHGLSSTPSSDLVN